VLILVKIALAQFEINPGHPDINSEKMLSMIQAAKKNNTDIIIFPEMSIPGYLIGDTWEQRSFLDDCTAFGEGIIAASTNICIMFGNIGVDKTKKNNDGRVRKYNAFFTAQNGKLLQVPSMPYPFTIKTLLPNYREFDDTRHFYSLQKLALEMSLPVESLISPLEIKLPNKTIRIGCLLCEDGWSDDYAVAPLKILNEKKCDLFVNISSSPYTLGKNEKRNRVFSSQAKSTGTPLIYVNNTGLQNNGKTVYTFDGSSTVYNKNGAIVALCKEYEEGLKYVSLSENEQPPAILIPQESDIAHIYKTLIYGIRKFLINIHMNKVVIGISGGIDSAVAAALYTRILGPENILLINMPSVFNSATTKGLSQQLAERLGCHYAILPIQNFIDYTIKQFETTPIINLTTMEKTNLKVSSFVTENIQARDRSARILAGMAASFGGGFTCNANKAETTVGYSTLYGDQSGFLAALADLWKHQVYDLAHYLNTNIYKREVIPQATIDIVPSAELSLNQCVDEGKGDPIKYLYHDYLFRAFVEHWNKTTPQEVLEWYAAGTLEENIGCQKNLVAKYFPTAKAFIEDLEHWWNLFTGMAVAKRIQAPPIIAISRRAYGFDHREAQNGFYYTSKYKKLKKDLLNM